MDDAAFQRFEDVEPAADEIHAAADMYRRASDGVLYEGDDFLPV